MADETRSLRRRRKIIDNAEARLLRLKSVKSDEETDGNPITVQRPREVKYRNENVTNSPTSDHGQWNTPCTYPSTDQPEVKQVERTAECKNAKFTMKGGGIGTEGVSHDTLRTPNCKRVQSKSKSGAPKEFDSREKTDNLKKHTLFGDKFFSALDVMFIFCFVTFIHFSFSPLTMTAVPVFVVMTTLLHHRMLNFYIIASAALHVVRCVCCVLFLTVSFHVISSLTVH